MGLLVVYRKQTGLLTDKQTDRHREKQYTPPIQGVGYDNLMGELTS